MANPNGTPANLQPWRPGQSGNPGGRPRGRSLTKILRDVLDGQALGSLRFGDDRQVANALVEALVGHAITSGSAALIKEIFERIDGPVKPADDHPESRRPEAEIRIPDRPPPDLESGQPAEVAPDPGEPAAGPADLWTGWNRQDLGDSEGPAQPGA